VLAREGLINLDMRQAKKKSLVRTFGDRMRPLRGVIVACALLLIAASTQAQTVKLERGWQFLADKEGRLKPDDIGSAQGWRDARVGLSWNAQFEDLRDYMGVAWYRTQVDVPELKDGRRALLRFGAVDYFCEVFVNGRKVGDHEGGYTPFSFDVTEALKQGANELLVRVVDPPMDERENRARFPEMMYNEIPHGKQNWYVQTGGIWQPVWLEVLPRVYMEYVHVTPRISGEFSLDIMLRDKRYEATEKPAYHGVGREQPEPLARLGIIVRDPEGKTVYERSLISKTAGRSTFRGRIQSPRVWDPDTPSLYTVEVSVVGLRADGRSLVGEDALAGTVKELDASEVDVKRERFGFRSFEARDGKFYLNNEPFYMIAALDQDFYPETIYTTPSEEYVRDQVRKAKRLGLNMLRCHIKVCDPIYLKVADEEGMLIWYEIPSWNDFKHFSLKAAERGERVFREMTERDWNHPSIVIQSIINESWGADLKKPDQRRWLLEAFDRAKKLVEPRGLLVVDNSACCDNFHLKTDINDFHQYFSQPDNHDRWDKWVADFATRPKWTFSQYGDAQPTGQEPLVVSEFGNWGLPKLPPDLPWWFARDFGGREVTRPAGVFERFRDFQLSTLFRDYNELAEATEWHQFRSLKHEIEEIRRHASIQGYVITEFTDINWEANGLMDMWRNPKVYADELAKIQQPDVVLARLPQRNFTGGERAEIPVLLSHYSDRDIKTVSLRWSNDTGGKGDVVSTLKTERASVELIGKISLTLPTVERPRRVQLSLRVIHVSGHRVAENSYDLFVYPKPAPATATSLMFYSPDQKFAFIGNPNKSRLSENSTLILDQGGPFGDQPQLYKALQGAGYRISPWLDRADKKSLLITTAVDEHVQRFLQSGGRAIIIANSKEALPAGMAFKVVPREGDLDGNWVTNFNWVRTNREPFSAVAFGPLLGFEGVKTVPRFVIEGVPPAAYTDVLSGIFYGWINNNRALAVQVKAGEGKMLLTTFRFDEYGRDPYATHLFDAMVRYVARDDFAPRLDWNAQASK
jgi:hypothetical protein